MEVVREVGAAAVECGESGARRREQRSELHWVSGLGGTGSRHRWVVSHHLRGVERGRAQNGRAVDGTNEAAVPVGIPLQ